MVASRPDPRRRSERAHRAILAAALELCRELGYAGLTIESIAAHAGVGKQTIYRWWPSKGAVLLDALHHELETGITFPDDGDFAADLHAQVKATVRFLTDPSYGPHLAGLIGEAQRDPDFAADLAERWTMPRRAVIRARFERAKQAGQLRDDVDVDIAIELVYGPLYSRLLLGTGPLDDDFATAHVELALTALRPAAPPDAAASPTDS